MTGEATEAEQQQQSATRLEKPMLIFINAEDDTDSDMRKLEDVVFADERVQLGAKFFDCVKMTPGDAEQDRLVKEAGRLTPRLIFVGRDYKVEDVIEGHKISSGKVVRAMQTVVRGEYETNFDTMVKEYRKLLDELDRLDSKRAYIADQKARLAEKADARRERKIQRDEEELQAEMADWTKKEQELLQLRRKGEEAPAES